MYLDAFAEEVQAAEDPAALLDPALDGVDTTTRTRVGWRVRAAPAQSATCSGATLPAPVSTGRLDVSRTAAPVPADPCAPPDDPRSKLPDGLLRIEVLDGGTATTARFAWSYAGGADAVAATVAALQDWCIDAATWAQLVAQLPDSPWPHRREPELGDRKRQSASIIVWTRITGGEHLFAPHPIRDQQPAQLRNAWRLSAYAMAARFRDGCTRPHDIDLDRLLTAYGSWLADHIDVTGTPCTNRGPRRSSRPPPPTTGRRDDRATAAQPRPAAG